VTGEKLCIYIDMQNTVGSVCYALGVGYRLLISKQIKLLLLLKYGTTAVINDRGFTYACIEDTVLYSLYVYD
jgi:hypothetical protein